MPPAGDEPVKVRLPSRTDLAVAVEEARQLLEQRLAEIDPALLVELTVGLRNPPGSDASWTDSWTDRFLDNGKFSDMWINLSGIRDRVLPVEDDRFGGRARAAPNRG
jgi:hypothetical protein